MYVRRIGGEEARFGVSGTLWRDALVFFDRRTGSWWSQVNGVAISGPLHGTQLEEIPSQVATWAQWKRLHPETLVLRPSKDSRGGSPYAGYFENAEQLGVLNTKNPDPRLPGKTIVIGIRQDAHAAAIPVDALGENPLFQAMIGSTPVVVVALSAGNARAYDRGMDGMTLGFVRESDGWMRDTRTGSLWNAETGVAVEGTMKGRTLVPLVARRVYWFVWAAYNPGSAILGLEEDPSKAKRGTPR